ncbi:hypothetical protein KDM41_00085 [bacterium]|nr:hypothetical protein [bacterium]
MAHRGFSTTMKRAAGLVAALLFVAASGAGAVEVRSYANGIRATIYGPGEILGTMKSGDVPGGVEIVTRNGTVVLAGDPDKLVPFDLDVVDGALGAMGGFHALVDVNVYLLPLTPSEVGSSFARQDGIYLAPGTGPVAVSTQAYIATHEMGHVLTWAFVDSDPARWKQYLTLRGLDPVLNGATADHADRAREILAEDLRHLFGGPEATATNSIENHDLALPERVAGLRELLVSFLSDRPAGPTAQQATAYPNPCNPLTTIAMAVPGSVGAASSIELRVYDIRGALVRTIAGGHVANGRVTVQWNGADQSGGAASSGLYLYVLRVDGLVAKGSVNLVR